MTTLVAGPEVNITLVTCRAEGVGAAAGKGGSLERCRFWPNCKNGDTCPYLHPTVPCRWVWPVAGVALSGSHGGRYVSCDSSCDLEKGPRENRRVI